MNRPFWNSMPQKIKLDHQNHKCAWPTLVSSGSVQGAWHSGNIDLNPLIIVLVHSCLSMQLNWLMVGTARLWIISSLSSITTQKQMSMLKGLLHWKHIAKGSSSCTNIITLPSCWYMAFGAFLTIFVEGEEELWPCSLHKGIRVIRKVTLSSPCLWAYFHPLSTLSVVVSAK